MQDSCYNTDSKPSAIPSEYRALQALAVLVSMTCLVLNEWMGSTVFPMAEKSLQQNLGDNYLQRLPDVSQWVLNF